MTKEQIDYLENLDFIKYNHNTDESIQPEFDEMCVNVREFPDLDFVSVYSSYIEDTNSVDITWITKDWDVKQLVAFKEEWTRFKKYLLNTTWFIGCDFKFVISIFERNSNNSDKIII